MKGKTIMNAKNIKIGMHIEMLEQDANENGLPDCATLKAEGTLFFLNANKLVDTALPLLEKADSLKIDFTEVERVDETALEKLKGLEKKAKAMGKTVEYFGLNADMAIRFEKFYEVL